MLNKSSTPGRCLQGSLGAAKEVSILDVARKLSDQGALELSQGGGGYVAPCPTPDHLDAHPSVHFRPVPREVTRKCGPSAAKTWATVTRFVPVGQTFAQVTERNLAEDRGVTVRTLRTHLRKLQAENLMTVERGRGPAAPNTYHLCWRGRAYRKGNDPTRQGEWDRLSDRLWDTDIPDVDQVLLAFCAGLEKRRTWASIARQLGLSNKTVEHARYRLREAEYMTWDAKAGCEPSLVFLRPSWALLRLNAEAGAPARQAGAEKRAPRKHPQPVSLLSTRLLDANAEAEGTCPQNAAREEVLGTWAETEGTWAEAEGTPSVERVVGRDVERENPPVSPRPELRPDEIAQRLGLDETTTGGFFSQAAKTKTASPKETAQRLTALVEQFGPIHVELVMQEIQKVQNVRDALGLLKWRLERTESDAYKTAERRRKAAQILEGSL